MVLKTIIAFVRTLLFDEVCVVCGEPGNQLHPACAHLLETAPPHRFPWITSIWNYRDKRVTFLIKKLKKHPHTELVRLLVHTEDFGTHTSPSTIIVPIPASPERMKKEGFNQAEVIAQVLARRLPGSETLPALVHSPAHKTKQAHIKKRSERIQNRKGCYLLDPVFGEMINDATIVLVDDVTTTGATLLEARRLLLDAGARSVVAYVLAH